MQYLYALTFYVLFLNFVGCLSLLSTKVLPPHGTSSQAELPKGVILFLELFNFLQPRYSAIKPGLNRIYLICLVTNKP